MLFCLLVSLTFTIFFSFFGGWGGEGSCKQCVVTFVQVKLLGKCTMICCLFRFVAHRPLVMAHNVGLYVFAQFIGKGELWWKFKMDFLSLFMQLHIRIIRNACTGVMDRPAYLEGEHLPRKTFVWNWFVKRCPLKILHTRPCTPVHNKCPKVFLILIIDNGSQLFRFYNAS